MLYLQHDMYTKNKQINALLAYPTSFTFATFVEILNAISMDDETELYGLG